MSKDINQDLIDDQYYKLLEDYVIREDHQRMREKISPAMAEALAKLIITAIEQGENTADYEDHMLTVENVLTDDYALRLSKPINRM